jgi:aryl carrier-like protein
MDALAYRRRSSGAHALSINWGSWNGVGMAAAVDEQHRRRWASLGLLTIEPEDGVRMLQELLYANRTAQAVALPLADLPETPGPFYEELTSRRRPSSRHATVADAVRAPVADILAVLEAATGEDRTQAMFSFVDEQVAKVFALAPSQRLDAHRSLMEMGMDSLMAMELRNRIQAALRVPVAVADLLKGPSIHELSTRLLAGVVPAVSPAAPAGVDAWEEGSL